MAVTIEQMAEAYIENIRGQIDQAKQQLNQQQQLIMQLEAHLQECQDAYSQKREDQNMRRSDGLPNPFEQLQPKQDEVQKNG